MAEMTHRERVLAALDHQQTDRVPIDFGGTYTTTIYYAAYDRLKEHLNERHDTVILSKIRRLAIPDETILRRFDVDTRFLGLGVYAAGTLLWLCCLSKIDLSLAFPGSALQLILVLSGASWLLGEKISTLQIIGTAIILGGLSLLFLDRGGRHA